MSEITLERHMKILVLGATGMLGSTVFKTLCRDPRYQTWGTVRGRENARFFSARERSQIVSGLDVLDDYSILAVLSKIRPDIIINCIGLIKQIAISDDPLSVLPINSILPHRLLKFCELSGAKLIQVSTDCVFSGRNGMYVEQDISDANDLYGKSKYIGEINDSPSALTLRTSIIGHELNSSNSLIDWFLSQQNNVKGYTNAIFSGLPTIELAGVIADYVLPNTGLTGLYHVSADPIDKYSLLKMVANTYGKSIDIDPDKSVEIDRSLNSTKFRSMTGYAPPSWNVLIQRMHDAMRHETLDQL
jgi:dTDP-4-dehydrorhamnose reductase